MISPNLYSESSQASPLRVVLLVPFFVLVVLAEMCYFFSRHVNELLGQFSSIFIQLCRADTFLFNK